MELLLRLRRCRVLQHFLFFLFFTVCFMFLWICYLSPAQDGSTLIQQARSYQEREKPSSRDLPPLTRFLDLPSRVQIGPLAVLFPVIYELKVQYGHTLHLPRSASESLEAQGIDLKTVHRQEVITVINKFTKTQAIYNPARLLRFSNSTVSSPNSTYLSAYLSDLLNSSLPTCVFCNATKFLSYQDPLADHLKTNMSFCAANTFLFSDVHPMFFPKRHLIIPSTEELYDLLYLVRTFLERQPNQKELYPFSIALDVLPKSGGSQVHFHFQGLHTEGHLHSSLLSAVAGEPKYFPILIRIHEKLGLSEQVGSAVVISPIDPLYPTELLIFSPSYNEDFFEAFRLVLLAHQKIASVPCVSGIFTIVSAAAVSDGLHPSQLSAPSVIGRIMNRGNCMSIKGDVSSFDLFVAADISTEPMALIRNVQMARYLG
ncbi:unnamed protein product [Cyprideis torosa]|uniref:Uncharacterized protein n=1 Tax=Cyprideis torosa TaxID=163714 RepID=A0A7R8ZMQ0_9CRUS|nr:unnamed protein product [Cyprideis torosa]CAG0884937.1 unnamed protein product [Cyprideis torosa]